MQRKEFEIFVQEANQHVYELLNQSKMYREIKNYEMAILSIELLIMQKMKKLCRAFITGLTEVGLQKKDDVIDLHIVMGRLNKLL